MAKAPPNNTDNSDFLGTKDWEEIDTEFGEKITWDSVGQEFIGTFLTMRPVEQDDGKTATSIEFDVKGEKFYTWAPARLLGAFTRAVEDDKLKPGQLVRIQYTGEEPSTKKGMSPSKVFKLSIRPL